MRMKILILLVVYRIKIFHWIKIKDEVCRINLEKVSDYMENEKNYDRIEFRERLFIKSLDER